MDNKSVIVADDFRAKAMAILPPTEFNVLMRYVEQGKHTLAPDTAARFFELFLNHNDVYEIHRLNRSFPVEAIMWARIKYDWDAKRDQHANALMSTIASKAGKAAMDSVSLVSDMITAATKIHGDKLKKFIQTGNEADLGDSMSIDNLTALAKAIETLQKLTGQDKGKGAGSATLNLNVTTSAGAPGSPAAPGGTSSGMSSEGAAAILAVVAAEKRKNGRK